MNKSSKVYTPLPQDKLLPWDATGKWDVLYPEYILLSANIKKVWKREALLTDSE